MSSSKEYYLAHPDKKREHDRKYQQKNKEKIAERKKIYSQKIKDNPEKYENMLATKKRWADKNPNYQKEYRKKNKKVLLKKWYEWRKGKGLLKWRKINCLNQKIRQANIRANGGEITREEWNKIKEEHNYTCPVCGVKEPKITLTIDHIIPVSKWKRWAEKNKPNYSCGDAKNIQPLCKVCNSTKNNKIIKH